MTPAVLVAGLALLVQDTCVNYLSKAHEETLLTAAAVYDNPTAARMYIEDTNDGRYFLDAFNRTNANLDAQWDVCISAVGYIRAMANLEPAPNVFALNW